MSNDRNGQIITFYSFKGGTGRTMALANVAWILAEQGHRVLVADWDLESPGLHRFFHPFLDANDVRQRGGVIDMIREFEKEASNQQRAALREPGWEVHFANIQSYAFPLLNYEFARRGSIDFLSAGRQNRDYKAGVAGLDWDIFYDRLGGSGFLDALRADMRANYDYTLIDSRTGLSDVADICTIHLPDVLVDCFTFSEQGIDGAATVAQAVSSQYENRRIRILPVPMRVDPAEKDKADAGRSYAQARFGRLPVGMDETERGQYWFDVEVPYQSWYAYEETLATFGDDKGARNSLLAAYEKITAAVTEGRVTEMPRLDPGVRDVWRERFLRKRIPRTSEVVVWYAPRDQLWFEWAERLLSALNITVVDGAKADAAASRAARSLVVASAAYSAAGLPRPQGSYAVYVDDSTPRPEFASAVLLTGLRPTDAVERVAGLFGRTADAGDVEALAGRYPGLSPQIVSAPIVGSQFTGREETLRALRAALRNSTGTPAIASLYGLGGVGKTQVALEYIRRFTGAYDLVWWVNADPAVLIDAALADLAEQIGVPRPANALASARAALDELRRGERYARWLLVFDNVEKFADIEDFIPQGGHGHVLVTTRDRTLAEGRDAIEVDVFSRQESVSHLQQRVPAMSEPDAERIAAAVGDLPIALTVAAAQLATSGITPAQYLGQLAAGETDEVVRKLWDVSLDRLERESPGAFRLLEILSVLAPEDIALELVNHSAMVGLLRDADATPARRPSAAKLIQQLNRLALLKIDSSQQRIEVHRIVQNVVRDRIGPDRLAEIQRGVLGAFAAMRPELDPDNRASWDRYRMIWPHLETETDRDESPAPAPPDRRLLFDVALDSDDPAVLELVVDRIRYVWVRGNLQQSSDLAERVEKTWLGRLSTITDPADRDKLRIVLLRAQFNHANALRERGRFAEAFKLDTDAFEQQSELLGETHYDTLMTSAGLGADLRALGQYGQALERDRATFAIWSEEFGETFPRTLSAQNNLATSLRQTGYFAEARTQDELAMQGREIVLGRRTYWPLWSQNALARDLRELGEYARSVALLEDVAASYAEDRGPDAVVTLHIRVNLAVSLRTAGRAEEAQQILDACYGALRPNGELHPETLACRLSRAINLLFVGEPGEAKAETVAARDGYAELLGAAHPHTLVCENNLSAIERARGDLTAALAAADRGCAGLAGALRPEHPVLLAARMNRAVFLFESGAVDEPLALAEALAGTTATALGAGHPDALLALANARLMRTPEPDAQVLAELTGKLGGEHPTVQALQDGQLVPRVLDPHPF